MATTSASAEGPTVSDSELSYLEDIETLKLKMGPAKRNLFGPVDHQQLQQDFHRLLCMSVEMANKRWNFDFQRDQPGEGADIKWVELRCQDVPVFYHSCSVRSGPTSRTRGTRRSSSSSGEGSPISSSSSGSGDEYLEVTTRGCYSVEQPQKHRQSAITDFFKVKKRKLLHYKPSSWQ